MENRKRNLVFGSSKLWRSVYVLVCVYVCVYVCMCVYVYMTACQGKAGSLRIQADGRKCTEPLGCLTCLYSRVGEPLFPQATCHPVGKPKVPDIVNVHKACRAPKHCITQRASAHEGPRKVIGIQFIKPSLKAMGTLLILVAQTSE